jgi:hypothetical protein
MKEIKRILLLAVFVVLTLAAHAQHFDWAKNFHGYGDEYTNLPRGLVAGREYTAMA